MSEYDYDSFDPSCKGGGRLPPEGDAGPAAAAPSGWTGLSAPMGSFNPPDLSGMRQIYPRVLGMHQIYPRVLGMRQIYPRVLGM